MFELSTKQQGRLKRGFQTAFDMNIFKVSDGLLI